MRTKALTRLAAIIGASCSIGGATEAKWGFVAFTSMLLVDVWVSELRGPVDAD